MSTDDIVEIQQLLARANVAVDGGDGPGYAACFTGDGVLDAGDAGGEMVGHAQIEAAGASYAEAMPGLRHWTSNHAIEVTGETATATVYLMVVMAGPEPVVAATGVYSDHLRRTDDGWLFTRRTPKMDTEAGPLRPPG